MSQHRDCHQEVWFQSVCTTKARHHKMKFVLLKSINFSVVLQNRGTKRGFCRKNMHENCGGTMMSNKAQQRERERERERVELFR